jgi:hypothetical protein
MITKMVMRTFPSIDGKGNTNHAASSKVVENTGNVRFEVFTAMTKKNAVF